MRTITLLSLLFISIFGNTQEQVSDVYFDELQYPISVGASCGFHSYNGVDYLTINNDSLQIFELIDGEMTLNHIIQYPKEVAGLVFGNISNNSSLKSIEGKYYYSFFSNAVYIIDLEEGSFYRSLDISGMGYRLYNVIRKTGNQIYFYGFHGESERAYFKYDISNNEMSIVDAPVTPFYSAKIIENTLYYDDAASSSIMGYDILKDSSFTTYQYEGTLISGLQLRYNLGEEYATFRDENGFKIIQKDHEVMEFLCDSNGLPLNAILALRGNMAILALKNIGHDMIKVYNQNDCELLQEISIDDDNYSNTSGFYITDNLVEDYTIIGYYGHYFGFGLGIVIDHTSNSESYAYDYDYVLPNAAKETDNAVYWIAYDEIELSPSYYYIMRFDKLSGSVSSISPYDSKVYSSSLGISKQDEIYFAANDVDNNYKIWKTLDGNQFTVAKELDYRFNLGVETRFDIRTEGQMVISNGIGGLMVTEANTDVISSGVYKRDIAVTDNYIATVITEGETNFVFKYNRQTGASSKFLLNQVEQYRFKPEITDKFIFNTDTYMQRYFDIETEEFKLLNHKNPSINLEPSKYYSSLDKMIITEWVDANNPQNYYFFDFETEVLEKIDDPLPRSFLWAITDKNIFYLDNTKVFLVEEEITRIKDGTTPKIVYAGDCSQINMSSTQELQTGSYAELFFRCDGEMLIIADDGISTYTTSFSTDASLFSGNINNVILYSNKDDYLLKSELEGQEKLFLYTAPSSLLEIKIPDTETYVTTSFDLDKPLLVTFNKDERIHSFYLFDKLTGELELKMQSSYGSGYVPYFRSNPHAISSSQFIATVRHETRGYELFEIDLENQVFDLKVDFYEGRLSSLPGNYTSTSDYLYFIAKLEKDGKQWFRVKTDLLSSNHEIVVESLLDMNVFPNPSSITINTSTILESYSVYNSQGQEVLNNSTNDIETIDISQLQNGHYIISGFDKSGLLYSSKFVKIE